MTSQCQTQQLPGTIPIPAPRTPRGSPPPADLPGDQPHRIYLSGDPEKARVTSVPLTDSKSDDLITFPEDQSVKTSGPTVSFVEHDQLHFYSGDEPPSYLGASVDKPHHPSELADRSPAPSHLPRDKICPPSGSPEENTSTAPLAYVTHAPAAAIASASEASWEVAEQPSAVEYVTATLQRAQRASRPLPLPPSQRPAEQPLVLGQVQTTASIGLTNPHKVRSGAGQWHAVFFQRCATLHQGVPLPRVRSDISF